MGFKMSNSLETSGLKISQEYNWLETREYRGEKNFESQAVITKHSRVLILKYKDSRILRHYQMDEKVANFQMIRY